MLRPGPVPDVGGLGVDACGCTEPSKAMYKSSGDVPFPV
jgi:hypothetical protein